MQLSAEEQAMLDGIQGPATQKAMEILIALGTIYGAERLIPVTSIQVAGVSYDNLGEAGLLFLSNLADGGGKAHVLTTLNPAGMDIENWESLGIPPDFAQKQVQVIQAFARMEILTTCTCTPYLAGNLPHFGEHISWSESSAVCFANSVIGARTNREGGPSALAASLTGRTPDYGMHQSINRKPTLTVLVDDWENVLTDPSNDGGSNTFMFGVLGKAIGTYLEKMSNKPVVYLRGIESATLEELKSFSASIATYGGAALFHMEGITPESACFHPPEDQIVIASHDLDISMQSLKDVQPVEVDFVSLGCPHLSIKEIARIAELVRGKRVIKEFWITTSRQTKQLADQMGYSREIEASGAKIAADTCCVVAPIKGRFHALATDSAKACYYAASKNNFKVVIQSFDQAVLTALGETSHGDDK